MVTKKTKPSAHGSVPESLPADPPAGDAPPPDSPPPSGGAALVEPPEEAVQRLVDEMAQLKDQYLRLAADHDNFRKRIARERTETWARAQADVVANILDALDDLGRVAHLDPQRTTASDLLAGVELVERKILKELESAGLERVGQPGEAFDPHRHEAVSTVPAPTPEQDHVISAVFQPGYRFGGALLRPARVQVQIWQDAPSPRAGGDGRSGGSDA
ncbi:MAG: nucleotide exchange factor GrpE [Gemmatimonadetes bacterium]|nr:nucleotide exchange factor GrpE [Gemmatimonadota bacterium]